MMAMIVVALMSADGDGEETREARERQSSDPDSGEVGRAVKKSWRR